MSTPPSSLSLRRAREEDWPGIFSLDARSFALPSTLPEAERAEFQAKVERAYVVHDRDALVATSLHHLLPLTVPGGAVLPAAGLSWVSVAATHRRRGVLRRMMAQQFADWRGLPLAALTASEGGIYERFGFGPACFADRVTIDPGAVIWRTEAPADSAVRYGTPEQIAARVPDLHDRWARTRPGALGRPDSWWPSILADRDFRRDSQISGLHHLLHDDGYAAYRLDAHAMSATVEELVAVTDRAHTDLWRVLTGLDLVRSITAVLPTDDPLPAGLRNARAVTVTGRTDELWISILDVPEALARRTYDVDGVLALSVTDDWSDRAGTYLLTVTDGLAEVRRTEADADGVPAVGLGISELSSLYCGGVRARMLAAAGRIAVDAPGTLDLLDALFTTRRAPFSGTFF
ncbi:MAG: GNAT family N-acetyltransferase [Gordonia sp. (in: high G+C Gram-positive bacteria)]|uniref:GNAT family N-acetyltransferase n=1 Tax=Gordonia sp. (in: high G+C Gram-positive bacteria) TaxID=84139 RepID=UPI0039E5DCE9